MNSYKLLSDAIIDGSQLTKQAIGQMVDLHGRACALGAAIHAIEGRPSREAGVLFVKFPDIMWEKDSCPVEQCTLYSRPVRVDMATLIPHLNDIHQWSRERIAGFVATVEERLGLVEIISDETERGKSQATASAEDRALSNVPAIASVLLEN